MVMRSPKTEYSLNPMPTRLPIRTLLILGTFSCSTLSAQTQRNMAGIKAGIHWSNLRSTGSDINDENARFAFHGGVFGRLAPTSFLAFQAELLFMPKGTTVTYDGLFDQEVSFKVDYLELPVFAVVGIGEILEVHGGLYAAFLLSSKVSTQGELGSGSDQLDRDNFQGGDYGLLLGAGGHIGRAQLGLRYTHGLSKLAASTVADALLGEARNATVQIYLAIGLTKK